MFKVGFFIKNERITLRLKYATATDESLHRMDAVHSKIMVLADPSSSKRPGFIIDLLSRTRIGDICHLSLTKTEKHET